MTPPPIDLLRMRIFSELNIHLGHHGIEKETMNIAAKHCAFLVRFYAGVGVEPLSVSVPIIDFQVFSLEHYNDIVRHKICLVVHTDASPSTTTSGTADKAISSKHDSTLTTSKEASRSDPTASAAIGKVKVLIEHEGAQGHFKYLIKGFAQIAGMIVGGILIGKEGLSEKDKGPVWDVSPWEDKC